MIIINDHTSVSCLKLVGDIRLMTAQAYQSAVKIDFKQVCVLWMIMCFCHAYQRVPP